MRPKVIFEDQSILVIDKPPFLVTTPADSITEPTLVDWILENYPQQSQVERAGVVHRLDKDTSGVILIAKSNMVQEALQGQFASRKTKKEYIALVHGIIEKAGKVEGSVGRNPGNREKFIVLDEGGKEAATEYEPIQSYQLSVDRLQEIFAGFNKIQMRKLATVNYNLFTLLRCKPLTGRTHQIRVHLKYINFPIVADEKYSGRKTYRLDKRWCPRQFLHAAKIGFEHPTNGEWVEFESSLPADLAAALELLTVIAE
jgi:23S rRNA pseudouridine1911/1915/1917 synthase